MNCVCKHSSHNHLAYGHYLKCKEESCDCQKFILKGINDIAIDDDLMILDLLYRQRWDTKTERTLFVEKDMSSYIKIKGHTSQYFTVTEGAVAKLKARWDLKGTPHWGYTDDTILHISESGSNRLIDKWNELGCDWTYNKHLRTENWLDNK